MTTIYFAVTAKHIAKFLNCLNMIFVPSVIETYIKNSDKKTITTFIYEGYITEKEEKELIIKWDNKNQLLFKMYYDYYEKIYEIIPLNGNRAELDIKLTRKTNIFKKLANWID